MTVLLAVTGFNFNPGKWAIYTQLFARNIRLFWSLLNYQQCHNIQESLHVKQFEIIRIDLTSISFTLQISSWRLCPSSAYCVEEENLRRNLAGFLSFPKALSPLTILLARPAFGRPTSEVACLSSWISSSLSFSLLFLALTAINRAFLKAFAECHWAPPNRENSHFNGVFLRADVFYLQL